MLAPLGFLLAGFFFHALPWAPLVAFLLQAWGTWSTWRLYRSWWEQSKLRTVRLVALQLTLAVIGNTALMLPGNWLRGLL